MLQIFTILGQQIWQHHNTAGHTMEKVRAFIPVIWLSLDTDPLFTRRKLNWQRMAPRHILHEAKRNLEAVECFFVAESLGMGVVPLFHSQYHLYKSVCHGSGNHRFISRVSSSCIHARPWLSACQDLNPKRPLEVALRYGSA